MHQQQQAASKPPGFIPTPMGGSLSFQSTICSVEGPVYRKASTSQAWITFFKSMFGAGILAMPNVMNGVGIPLAVIIFTVVSIICSYTCFILLEARIMIHDYLDETNNDTDVSDCGCTDNDNVHYSVENSDNSYLQMEDGSIQNNGGACCNVSFSPHQHEYQHQHQHQLITYGDLAQAIAGKVVGTSIRCTIIALHVLFTCGLVICIEDTVEELLGWAGETHSRVTIGVVLFPILACLVQLPWLQDLWQISALSLFIYVAGVIGCSLYTSIFQEISPEPEGKWEFKWDGMLSFLGTSVYTLEGIGLVLPTVHSMSDPSKAQPVVISSILAYGTLTILYASIVFSGGVGGIEKEDYCDIVTKCIDPVWLRTSIEISLVVGLGLTFPVFLYPATEMLEIELANLSRRESLRLSHESTELEEPLRNGIDDINHASLAATNNSPRMETPARLDAAYSGHLKNWKLRLSLAFVSVTVGTVVTSFASFSAFVGSVLLTYAGFILPTVLYYKALEKTGQEITFKMKMILSFLLIFGLFTMIVGGVSAFLNILKHGM